MGIATVLLDTIIRMIQQKILTRNGKGKQHGCSFVLIATTLTILENANQFYTKHGFCIHSDRTTTIRESGGDGGELQIRTYSKVIKVN